MKRFLAITLLAAMCLLNVTAALVSAGDAYPPANTDKLYSAGDQLVQEGVVIGCSCPRTSGKCVCVTSTPK